MPSDVSGVGASSTAAATSTAIKNSKVNTDQFLRLLVTQLQNQDPLNPLSNEDFLTQLAQFQSLEETMETAANTKNLLLSQQLAAASALIGKDVVAGQGVDQIQGRVDKVIVSEGQVRLVVGGIAVDLSEITQVSLSGQTGTGGQ